MWMHEGRAFANIQYGCIYILILTSRPKCREQVCSLNLMIQHSLLSINHNSYSSQTWQLNWKSRHMLQIHTF